MRAIYLKNITVKELDKYFLEVYNSEPTKKIFTFETGIHGFSEFTNIANKFLSQYKEKDRTIKYNSSGHVTYRFANGVSFKIQVNDKLNTSLYSSKDKPIDSFLLIYKS